MSIQEKFLAMEAVLQYHYSMTRMPMTVDDLKARVCRNTGLSISLLDLQMVNSILPGAYTLDKRRKLDYVETDGLPHNAVQRKLDFLKGNSAVKTPGITTGLLATSSTTKQIAKPKREIIKGRTIKGKTPLAPVIANAPSMEDIYKRILAKQTNNVSQEDLDKDKQEKFLKAQVPAIFKILCSLNNANKSYSLGELVDKLTTSLPTKLSPSEIGQAINLLASQMPAFCSVIPSGKFTVVKLTVKAVGSPSLPQLVA